MVEVNKFSSYNPSVYGFLLENRSILLRPAENGFLFAASYGVMVREQLHLMVREVHKKCARALVAKTVQINDIYK